MKSVKRILAFILATIMLLGVFAGCKNNETSSTQGGASGDKSTYTVSVKSFGGMAMAGVQVYIYADDTLQDLQEAGETKEDGTVSFQLPVKSGYAVKLDGVPKGYDVAASYAFTGNSAAITLTSQVIPDQSMSGANLSLGDVMYDFSVTTPDGTKITLSEVLKEKEAVLLNFWYTTCSACIAEFPYMNDAYEQYKDEVEVIAVNPFEGDAAVKAFQENYGLTFPMAACPSNWATAFNVNGANVDAYPTSILIDRYGVICLMHEGGITSQRPFNCIFDHFTGEDYNQKICQSIDELITNVRPTYTMDDSATLAGILNGPELQVTYRPEEDPDSAEYTWPFIQAEKNGELCVKASNQGIEDSWAILYADVYLEAGQALGFDYLISSEHGCDALVVIVDGEDIFQISGVDAKEKWASCYPCVAEESRTYELALCYLKDESGNEGDDTAYIKNLRAVSVSQIDTATYIPRLAAASVDGFEFTYPTVVYNEKDGYYHVGSANGPLLLADLMGYTLFNEEKSVFDMIYDGEITQGGHNYYDELVEYCSYASNSNLTGVCTVNKELAELLKIVAQIAGFDSSDENEWLKICKYYQVYGSQKQLEDPIQGLAPFSAPEAKLGKNVATNYFYYDRLIIPRGKLMKFTPTTSGVYRITSHSESQDGVEAWIFDENREILHTYEPAERMYNYDGDCSIVYYMEAGKSYYIDIAFWDLYHVGYIYFDIEYIGRTYSLFRAASPGYFTYDTDATGENMYYTITGGIDVVLGDDGIYYHDLGGGKKGSVVYADFTGISIFDDPIATVNGADGTKIKGLIEKGGFDFSKTEDDEYVLYYLEKNGNDVAATEQYLREMWGEDYDHYAEAYQLADVFAGRYHGTGEDYTAQIRTYLGKMLNEGAHPERAGCVVVTKELAEILQMLMDKYTFKGVENSWLKLCYYYENLG